ncbi:MAG: AmmeMemoRadiSam system protein B [Treponema sp.]|mgnify:FL=1|nr:AmmeMemoRadiSam system protein B [Treponema sp.]
MTTKQKLAGLRFLIIFVCANTCISLLFFCSSNNSKTEATAPLKENSAGADFSKEIEKSRKAKFFCQKIDSSSLMPTYKIKEESFLPQNVYPIAGIVSHHLLAHVQIEKWFEQLASKRNDISTFIVLSPSHWHLSTGLFSVTFGSWVIHDTENDVEKILQTDILIENKLLSDLNARIDDNVFSVEHGVSTLAPYIKRYFPNAKIAAIAYNGEPPVNQIMAQNLCDAIKQHIDFEQNPNKNDVFLLISADFSHHQNVDVTKNRDNKSRHFLENISSQSWILAICDNRPAMYLLKNLLPENIETSILFNTNSYELSNKDENDITSYFFCYFGVSLCD